MSNQINGKLQRAGVVVLEIYSVQLNDAAAQQQFAANRAETYRALIEQEGLPVNKLTILKTAEMNLLRNTLSSKLGVEGQYHIVYPENERSGWICCCAD